MYNRKRLLIEINGLVEGVGFRPFVYKLANELKLGGYVKNDSTGVYVEVEGDSNKLNEFIEILKSSHPPSAEIFYIKIKEKPTKNEKDFKIIQSTSGNKKLPVIPPDMAICQHCKIELHTPEDKRFYYPFINCTNCGPRFSIVEDVPYDRVNTSMKEFTMCSFCKKEYEDIQNRRFHAQPVACFECGPNIQLLDKNKIPLIKELPKTEEEEEEEEKRNYIKKVIQKTASLILQGNIIAIKGIGGFQLVCRADNDSVVKELRKRKKREEKPFALMFRNIEEIQNYCYLSDKEKELLASYISPIVLLKKRDNIKISNYVSPRNPFLGCMIPYSPLHNILMEEVKIPIVCTSANISDEPICIDNEEAFERLNGIADYFLIHNRRIVRHIDDSVVKVTPGGNQIIIRRARGYVPKPILLNIKLPHALAVGGHLKNTIAISLENYIILSQHIGDLETLESVKAFEKSIKDFLKFYDITPKYIVSDLHPDYISTQYAEKISKEMSIPLVKVQHHFSHILSVMAENNIEEKVIGVSWDGTGYGNNGEIWGSEFIFVSNNSFERIFHFLPIPLIGGDKAIKETYRIGIALLITSNLENEARNIFGHIDNFEKIAEMFKKKIFVNSSGAGRLFDGVSSILGISNYSHFEGQSAMELEFEAYKSQRNIIDTYEYDIKNNIIDWRKIIVGIISDIKNGLPKEDISIKFHNTMVRVIKECVTEISKIKKCKNVALSGGVFQNSLLVDKLIEELKLEGFDVYTNKKVPPNDGGISLGQLFHLKNLNL
ncbi:MAG: carbamoyltransferase HypF [Brevinematales bacterium]|nr:carbamoyltransferase HypF [Brevinematales bacterium]